MASNEHKRADVIPPSAPTAVDPVAAQRPAIGSAPHRPDRASRHRTARTRRGRRARSGRAPSGGLGHPTATEGSSPVAPASMHPGGQRRRPSAARSSVLRGRDRGALRRSAGHPDAALHDRARVLRPRQALSDGAESATHDRGTRRASAGGATPPSAAERQVARDLRTTSPRRAQPCPRRTHGAHQRSLDLRRPRGGTALS